jgi:hypothetical protein
MKKRILIVALIGMLLAIGLILSSCGFRECDAGNCGNILVSCQNTAEVACKGLIGGNTNCSDACSD